MRGKQTMKWIEKYLRYTTTSLRSYPKINYKLVNYCRRCGITCSKNTLRCPQCNQQVRTNSSAYGSGLKQNRGLIE